MAKNPATVIESRKVLKTKELALFQGFEDAYQVLCERLRTHQFTHGLNAKVVAHEGGLLLRLKLNKKARALVVPRQLENGDTVYVITDLILDHHYGNIIDRFNFARVDRILTNHGLLQPESTAAAAAAAVGGGAAAPQAQVDVVDASFYGGQIMEFTGGQIACSAQLDRHLDDDAFQGLITGPAGSGKTCMIVQTAHKLAYLGHQFVVVAKSPAVRRLIAAELPEKYKESCFDYESLLRDIGVLFDNAAGQPTVLNDEQQPLEVVGEDYFREFFKNAKNRSRRVQKAKSGNGGCKDLLAQLTWEQLHQEFSLMLDEFDDYKSQSVFITDVSQKRQLWNLFQEFNQLLAKESKCYLPFHDFSVQAEPYQKKVEVDEGADFTRRELRSARKLCPWLLVHGDDDQALIDPTQPMLWYSREISAEPNHGVYRLNETLRSSQRAVVAGNRLLQAKKHLGKKVTAASQVIHCGSHCEGQMFSHIGNKSGTEWWYEQVETMVMCHPSRASEVQSDLSAVQVSSVAGYKGLSCGRAVIVDLLCASAEEANRLAGLFLKTIDGKKSRYQLDEECAELELFINHLYVAIMRSTDEVALIATKNLPDLNRLSQLLTQRDPAVLQEVKQVSVQPKPDTKAASDRTAWEHQLSRLKENAVDEAVVNAIEEKIRTLAPKPKSPHGGSKEKVVQPVKSAETQLAKNTFRLKHVMVAKKPKNNKKKSKGKKKSKPTKEGSFLVMNSDALDAALNLNENEFNQYLRVLKDIHLHADFRGLADEVCDFYIRLLENKEEKFERKINAHKFYSLFMTILRLNHKDFALKEVGRVAIHDKDANEVARLRKATRLAEDDVKFDIIDGNKMDIPPLVRHLFSEPDGIQFMRGLLNENEDLLGRVMSVNRMSARPTADRRTPVFVTVMKSPEYIRFMQEVLDKNADLFFQIVTPKLLSSTWMVGTTKVPSVFHTWSTMDEGLDLLLAACEKSPDKFNKFLTSSLLFNYNFVDLGGYSNVLYALSSYEKGCQLLNLIYDLNASLFNKLLEKDYLHDSFNGNDADNVFFRLCFYESGRMFLLNMANKNNELFLRSMNIPQLLVTAVEERFDSSPFVRLAQTANGCEILFKIFERDLKSLLLFIRGGEFEMPGQVSSENTPLYLFSRSQAGCELLLKIAASDVREFSKWITPDVLLKRRVLNGTYVPLIYEFLARPAGCDVLKVLFENNRDLFRFLVDNGHLIVQTQPTQDSIFSRFCRSESSCKLLLDMYDIFPNEIHSVMTADVMLEEWPVGKTRWTILYALSVRDSGCKFLEKILEVDQGLFYELIARRGFFKRVSPSEYDFPLVRLCYEESGCHFLLALFDSLPKHFMRMITVNMLMHKIMGSSILHAFSYNKSGVQFLLNCIDHRPNLLKALIRRGAFHVAHEGEEAITPFHYLCSEELGLSFLEKLSISYPNEFVYLMTADALLTTNFAEESNEMVLYGLVSSEIGCKLLERLQKLNPQLFIELVDRGGFSKSTGEDLDFFGLLIKHCESDGRSDRVKRLREFLNPQTNGVVSTSIFSERPSSSEESAKSAESMEGGSALLSSASM